MGLLGLSYIDARLSNDLFNEPLDCAGDSSANCLKLLFPTNKTQLVCRLFMEPCCHVSAIDR